MPNPNTNFKDSFGTDLGNKLITKEYLMTVYPQIAANMITPQLWVWGINAYGRLGTFSSLSPLTPITTFAGGANWKQVTAGFNVTAAIKTDGTLWTWGSNSNGELGDNTRSIRCTPVTTFAGGNNWKQVECNYQHTAAIKTDGTLWLWGASQFSNFGHLGINNSDRICTPVTTFAGGNDWKQVSCGYYHTAAIKTDGTLWTWGRNGYGCLGVNTSVTSILTPVTTFAGGTNWKQVSCGQNYTAAIKTDGTLWNWGRADYGQLGNNTSVNSSTPVTTFAGGTNWKQVSSKNVNISAIKTDGTLWTWGRNYSGSLGDNTIIHRSTPVTTFAGGTNWKQVSISARSFTTAIKTDGTLWVWGGDTYALGIGGNPSNSLTPVTTFAGGTNWKQVSAGYGTAAIKTSDDLL